MVPNSDMGTLTFSHLADTFIQSYLQARIAVYKCFDKSNFYFYRKDRVCPIKLKEVVYQYLCGAHTKLHNVFQEVWSAYKKVSGAYGEEKRKSLLQVVNEEG